MLSIEAGILSMNSDQGQARRASLSLKEQQMAQQIAARRIRILPRRQACTLIVDSDC
jgi:hypothetical protein